MEQRFKSTVNPKKFIIALSALAFLLGLSTVVISDYMIVPFVACYASLLWFEKGRKPICAVLGVLLVAFSVLCETVEPLQFSPVPFGALFSVSCGLCISLLLFVMYRFRCTKNDTAIALTAFFSFYLIFALFLSIGAITKDYSLAAITEYYKEFTETQKAAFVDACSKLQVTDEKGVSHYLINAENAELLYLSVARLTVAFLVIAAFLLCGIALKVFTRLVAYAERDDAFIVSWRFLPPNIFAYSYAVIFAVSFFLNTETAFGMAMQNLSYIFMAVFVYLGLRHLLAIASHMQRKGLILIILGFGLLFFSLSALQILSFLGVYVTVVYNKNLSEDKQ